MRSECCRRIKVSRKTDDKAVTVVCSSPVGCAPRQPRATGSSTFEPSGGSKGSEAGRDSVAKHASALCIDRSASVQIH